MRTIDADELLKSAGTFEAKATARGCGKSILTLAKTWLWSEVNKAPTIDAVPVVHGEWVVCGDGENVPWMCSHCGKTTAHKYKVMYGNYCPNCGARMDGKSCVPREDGE